MPVLNSIASFSAFSMIDGLIRVEGLYVLKNNLFEHCYAL